MEQHTGACMFCGQTQVVMMGDGATLDQIDKMATMQCVCEEAMIYKRNEQKKTYAEANVKKLFESDGTGLQKVLMEAIEHLAKKNIVKITITTKEGVKATLTARENSIKCERALTDKKVLED